ncbi:MAG: DUF2272 domain-containing protein [Bacteroidota bacterium]
MDKLHQAHLQRKKGVAFLASEEANHEGISLAAPPFSLATASAIQRQPEKKDVANTSSMEEAPTTKASTKDQLKRVFDHEMIHASSKEEAFDALAEFISENTLARRYSKRRGKKRKGTVYGYAKGSLRISGDTEAMTYLHNIGYWKDKPRRVAKAAQELYDQWHTEETDEKTGESKIKTLSEKEEAATEKLRDIVGVTRVDGEKRKEEQAELDRQQKESKSKDRLVLAGDTDSVIKNIRKKESPFAWSASTISKIHHMAGSGDTFPYAEGHVVYARRTKANRKKDNIEGLEKLHRAFGNKKEAAAKVAIGDTLHRGRIEQSTYEDIYEKTHSDVVVAIEAYTREEAEEVSKPPRRKRRRRKKGKLEKFGSYEQVKGAYEEWKKVQPDLSLEQYISNHNIELFAVVIGGNTSDYAAPNKADKIAGSNTLGKNFVPLNPDLTIKARTGNNDRGYKSKNAYFGVQKTDY